MSEPTVVLVHGSFADASSWSRVIARLRDAGLATEAVPNPLRGLTSDGEYVASILDQIEGPIVLVGHSYGGAVATYASSDASNVMALVYVASFGLDKGMGALPSTADFAPSELAVSLLPRTYPNGEEPGTDFYIQPEKFASVFCADLPLEDAALGAVSQRPTAEATLGEPLAVEPGWKRVPSWFVIPTADHAINPDSQRAAAERMGATTIEIEGASHAVAMSQASRVTEVILDAVAAVREPVPA
jgi:pimeloyl-ACP methyl ester carboxylesterase